MSWPFVTRELTVVARRYVVLPAAIFHVVMLAGFTLTWGLKLPILTGRSIYDILRLFEWAVLAALLPWIAARCQAPDRGDAMVMLSTLAARRPSAIVVAKILSLAGILALVAMAGLPAAIVAQKMSAVPFSEVVRDLAVCCALALFASAVSVAWLMAGTDAIAAWIGAAATIAIACGALYRWSSAPLVQASAIAAVAAAVTIAVATWSDRAFQYCDE
jgi:hypothetical protein